MFEVIEDGWHSFLPEQEFELYSSAVSNLRELWVMRNNPTPSFTCENDPFLLMSNKMHLTYSCLTEVSVSC